MSSTHVIASFRDEFIEVLDAKPRASFRQIAEAYRSGDRWELSLTFHRSTGLGSGHHRSLRRSDPVLSPFKSKHMARLRKLSRVKWPCAKPSSRSRNWENVGFSEGKRPTGPVNIYSGRSVPLNKRPLFVWRGCTL